MTDACSCTSISMWPGLLTCWPASVRGGKNEKKIYIYIEELYIITTKQIRKCLQSLGERSDAPPCCFGLHPTINTSWAKAEFLINCCDANSWPKFRYLSSKNSAMPETQCCQTAAPCSDLTPLPREWVCFLKTGRAVHKKYGVETSFFLPFLLSNN